MNGYNMNKSCQRITKNFKLIKYGKNIYLAVLTPFEVIP